VFVNHAFLSQGNAVTVFDASAYLGVLVIGESLVLLCGYFDLSLESTVAFAPMVGIWLTTSKSNGGLGLLHNGALGLVAVLLAGALVGLFNGVAIVFLRLNAFMVTLGMLVMLRGLTYWMTDGATISLPNRTIVYIGQRVWFGWPSEIYVAVGLFVVAAIFLRYHRVGRSIYAIGGNSEAARAAGIRVNLTLVCVFVAASVLAAIAGLILAGQLNAITVAQGQGDIFNVFAAACIGSISLSGGRGTMFGAGLGVLFFGVIDNVLTLAQVPSEILDAATGAVILLALGINRFTYEKE